MKKIIISYLFLLSCLSLQAQCVTNDDGLFNTKDFAIIAAQFPQKVHGTAPEREIFFEKYFTNWFLYVVVFENGNFINFSGYILRDEKVFESVFQLYLPEYCENQNKTLKTTSQEPPRPRLTH